MLLDAFLHMAEADMETLRKEKKPGAVPYLSLEEYKLISKDKGVLVSPGNEVPAEAVANYSFVAIKVEDKVTTLNIEQLEEMYDNCVIPDVARYYKDNKTGYRRMMGLDTHVVPNRLAKSLAKRCPDIPVLTFAISKCEAGSIPEEHYKNRIMRVNPVYKAAMAVLVLEEVSSILFVANK